MAPSGPDTLPQALTIRRDMLPDTTFWPQFWPQLAATLIGVVFGVPASLAITAWASSAAKRAALEEKKKRAADAIAVLIEAIETNKDVVIGMKSGGGKMFLAPSLEVATWEEVRADVLAGDLDPLTKTFLGRYFASIQRLARVNEILADFQTGIRGDRMDTQGLLASLIERRRSLASDAETEGEFAVLLLRDPKRAERIRNDRAKVR
jgi:hypothetical protein